MLGESGTCQQVLILIALIVLLFVSQEKIVTKCKRMYEGLVPDYCTPEYIRNAKLIPGGAAGAADECKEEFSNTLKDVYGFNDITHRIRESTSNNTLPLPKNASLGNNMAKLPSDNSLNQLL